MELLVRPLSYSLLPQPEMGLEAGLRSVANFLGFKTVESVN